MEVQSKVKGKVQLFRLGSEQRFCFQSLLLPHQELLRDLEGSFSEYSWNKVSLLQAKVGLIIT